MLSVLLMPTVWPGSPVVRVHAHSERDLCRVRVGSWGWGEVNDTREETVYDQTET